MLARQKDKAFLLGLNISAQADPDSKVPLHRF
jgi:hypothetical protein